MRRRLRLGYYCDPYGRLAQIEIALRMAQIPSGRLHDFLNLGLIFEDYDATRPRDTDLDRLRRRLSYIAALPNRQQAGYELERFLFQILELYGAQPRSNIRVPGEQIDLSFRLDGNTYLLEAKCWANPVDSKELRAFTGVLDTKSPHTRAVLVSMSGYTAEAVQWARSTRRVLILDQNHLNRALSGVEPFDKMMLRLERHLDETGDPYRLPDSDASTVKS